MGPSAIGYRRSTCRTNPRNEVLFLRVRCQTLPCSGPPRPLLEYSKLRCQLSVVLISSTNRLTPGKLCLLSRLRISHRLSRARLVLHNCIPRVVLEFPPLLCDPTLPPPMHDPRCSAEVVSTFATNIIFRHSTSDTFRNEGKVASTADRRTVLAANAGAQFPASKSSLISTLLYLTSQARFIVSANLQLQIRINQS